jgi:hypothetical protein
MIWFDPDRDDDLDLVTASYDMEFGRLVGGEYVSDGDHGVWFVERTGSGWEPTQLADLAHALAVTTVDLDGDGDDDLIVGNDYGVPDAIWLWDDGWVRDDGSLSVTAANTMSFDVADVDADGDEDLYATDMVPFGDDNPDFWAAMAEMDHDPPGPQLVENVLVDLGDGSNGAPLAGVAASGWSWSGRFADFDHDTDVDLYVANGMAGSPLYLLEDELQEENVAFRNDGTGRYEPAAEWGLGTTVGSRGVALGDLDGDGDLDVVVSTVGAPARIFENLLCGAPSLIVEPRQAMGNTHAVGAEVVVTTDGPTMRRTLRSGIGYLAAEATGAHFGLGSHRVLSIEVRWPDGSRTVIDAPEPGRIRVTRR